MVGKCTIPVAGIILATANSIIIRGDTTLLIVRTRDDNCLSEAASPIIIIMSCNTRLAALLRCCATKLLGDHHMLPRKYFLRMIVFHFVQGISSCASVGGGRTSRLDFNIEASSRGLPTGMY